MVYVGTTEVAMELNELGRFSESGLQVLVAVAAGPKHGWAVTEEIEARCGRRPQPATLYGTLSRLEARGWIVGLEPEGRRRPFAITPAGEAVLRARLSELEQLLHDGRRALKLGYT
jgi:DNA-binding PadR family transcriptional regulator